jgi:hypothetical protein
MLEIARAPGPDASIADSAKGGVVWLSVDGLDDLGGDAGLARSVTATTLELVAALQRRLAAGETTVSVAVSWPTADMTDEGRVAAEVLTEVARGVVQSLLLESGAAGIRSNVIVCDADQEADLKDTLEFIGGPDGGYTAGATIDLRTGTA